MKPLLGAAIGAAGSIAGNVIQNQQQDKRDAKARQFQMDLWNKANQYNSPANMMNRMTQAGLNPNLLAGQPVSGAASVPQPATGSRSASFDDIVPSSISVLGNLGQLQQQREQNALLHEQARQLKMQNDAEEQYGKEYGDIVEVVGDITRNEQDGSLNLPETKVRYIKPRNSYEMSVYDRHKREYLEQIGLSKGHDLTDADIILKYDQHILNQNEITIAKERAAKAVEFVEQELRHSKLTNDQLDYTMLQMLPDIIYSLGLKSSVTFDESGIPIAVSNYDSVMAKIAQFVDSTRIIDSIARIFLPLIPGKKK